MGWGREARNLHIHIQISDFVLTDVTAVVPSSIQSARWSRCHAPGVCEGSFRWSRSLSGEDSTWMKAWKRPATCLNCPVRTLDSKEEAGNLQRSLSYRRMKAYKATFHCQDESFPAERLANIHLFGYWIARANVAKKIEGRTRSWSLGQPDGLKPNVVYLKYFLFSLHLLLEIEILCALFIITFPGELFCRNSKGGTGT